MSEVTPEVRKPRWARRVAGAVIAPVALAAAVVTIKPFGFDPIGEYRNSRQPDCVIKAPNHRVSLSAIILGLEKHDGKPYSDTFLLIEADGRADIWSTEAALDLAHTLFDYTSPGEKIIVPHIGRSACQTESDLVPQLPTVELFPWGNGQTA